MEVVKGVDWQKPLPEPDPLYSVFWEAAGEGRLLYQLCPNCGHRQFYPRPLCLACGADPEWAEASGVGEVYTYTVVRQFGAPPFKDELPYVVAMIALPEGVQMLGSITDCDVDAVRIGLPVEAYAIAAGDGIGIPFWRLR
ncbi:MAG: Zn-ribbon domain-containing OB-fold protein [Myxococcota bacterium]